MSLKKRFREVALVAGLLAGTEGCATTPPNRAEVEAGVAYNKPDSSSKKPESEQEDIEAKLEEQRKKTMIESYASTVQRLDAKIDEIIGEVPYSARVIEEDQKRVQNLQKVLELFRRAIIIHKHIECHIIIDTNKKQTNFTEHVSLRLEEGVQQTKEIYGPLVEAEKVFKKIFEKNFLRLLESAKNSLEEFDHSSLTFDGPVFSAQAVDSLGRQVEYISALQELIRLYGIFAFDRQMVFMVDEGGIVGSSEDEDEGGEDSDHFIIP